MPINDLTETDPIVDPATGRPTPYFMRMIMDRGSGQLTLEQQVALLNALEIIAGAGLDGGGILGNGTNITVDANASAILDLITSTRGSVLYRGVAAWAGLAPGTSGHFLKSNGAGADPSYAAASGGGGADLGPDWTTLTFGSSSSLYGQTVYESTQSFTLAAGQRLEADTYIRKTIDTDGGVWAGNGTNGHNARAQLDNNNNLYRRSGGADTSIAAAGASTYRDYTGVHRILLCVNCPAASSNFISGDFNSIGQSQTAASTAFDLVGVAQKIALQTGDISKCYARARIVG